MQVLKTLVSRRIEIGLLIAAAIVVTVMLAALEVSSGEAVISELAGLLAGFVGLFALAHVALCFIAPHADQIMLPVTALLNGIGLVMVYRIDLANGSTLASRQVLWSFVGVVLFTLVLTLVRDHRPLARYSYLFGLIGLVLLALPLVWPAAINADARIWITIGPFSLQPGEFSKILLLLFFAQLLVNKRALFTVAGYRIFGIDFPRLRDLAPVLFVWAVAIAIMGVSNDFGPALLLFVTVLGMIYLATSRASWLIIGVALVAIGGAGIYFISDKIQDRFSNFIDPLANFDSTGYQLSQGLFGLSWGGFTGTGLGEGYPELIPVVESDFILAAVGEELGLFGLTVIILLFAVLVTRGLRAAVQVSDGYGKLVASGLSLTLIIQVFVVVGGISALLPMTGLTTPFMSAGGSSLMANYILLAILMRISDSAQRPQPSAEEQAERAQRQDAQPAAGERHDSPSTGYIPRVPDSSSSE
ncbi:FtsW/RodA/SpoVE family cell cycle protein [Corynebacterium otitidis]|uniref:FtsW/RodA/SpoVE family cell cycle protein n=1 Tax=Corynebacterium otitidis TaxID=29321 RepID=UPI000627B97F|nr:FtsW/RodA/SpoVE family cell cycle protein [Corynebacterium otitidis]KKO83968.1 cell division protein FtsW [Corynebacterium otitidis]